MFSHPVYLFLREFSLQDFRGGSKTQANHELASLSRVYGWGYERGYVKNNPCKGVRKFSLKARTV
ncbi:hypothetical protein CRE08_31060, partial [Escherichia coli]